MTPSRRRRPLGVAQAVVLVVTLVSAGAVLAALLQRSTVPFEIQGVVVSIDERNRDPGTEVWVINLTDGRRWFVDEATARAFRPGTTDKAAWSRQVRTGADQRTIGLSRDVVGPMAWVMLVTIAIGSTLLVRGRQGTSSVSSQL